MADQCCIPSQDSTGRFIRVHGDPPPAQRLSPIQLASNRLQPIATTVQEVANESGIFMQRATHHQANPQQVGEPVEDELEESEMEGLIGTLEIIGPSPETFAQLPLPSAQPSSIPCPSPSQGQAPPQPPTPQIPLAAAAATNADKMVQHLLCALVMLGQSMAQNPTLQGPAPVLPTQTHTQAPDAFDRSNLEDLQAFLLQCQIMFNMHPQNFTSESAKVCFAISYLKKSALEWFEQGILEDDPSQAPGWKSSWTEFVKELWTHFRPANPTGAAEAELQHLTMSSRACLSEYLVRFNTLASRVEWGDAVLCFQFYDGLPDQLKDRIALLRKPDNLQELVQVTICHDNLYWECQDEHKQARQQQPPRNTTGQPQSDQPPDCPNEQHLNVRGRLKDEERRRCHNNNLCLFCGKSDHTITKCPAAATKGQAAALPTKTPTETPASEEPTGP